MGHRAWIGIDFGTSGCRVCAIDVSGHVIIQEQQAFPASQHSTLSPEQQANVLFDVLNRLIQQLSGWTIESICIDATSGSVMLCDAEGQPLSDMLMYHDQRAIDAARKIARVAPPDSAVHGVSSGLAKFIHLQQTLKWPQSCLLVHQADWLTIQLGGQPGITDYNNALKSGYDVQNLQWPEWIQAVTVTKVLPKVVPPGTVIGQCAASVMQRLGIKQATPPTLKAGTTDSLAAFIATGANQTGEAVTSLGSTLVLKLLCEHPIFDAERGIYSHKLGNRWLAGGASNTGGAVLSHFFNQDQLMTLSQQIDLTQPTLDYYPLLRPGERFPIADPAYPPRLQPRPTEDHLFLYGLLTGIARIEKAGYECLQQLSETSVKSIRTVGGGARNPVWTTIRQSLLQVPFTSARQTEAAYGSALLAKDGLTFFE